MAKPQPIDQPHPMQADPTDRLRRAAAFHRRGALKEAEALYRQVLDVQPGNFDALHLCGVLMQQRGRSEEALALIGAALAANAQAAPAHSNHGLVLAALGRHEEALAAYDRAVALKPDYAEAYNNRGNALRRLERCREALASFDRALDLRPAYAEAHNNRGNALAALGRAEEALAAYDAALAAKPDYADSLINRAGALHRLKRSKESLASLDVALSLMPGHATALVQRAHALRVLDRPAEALAAYDAALARDPDNAECLLARGNLFYTARRYGEALKDYDRTVALRPDFAEAHNNRGNALSELGRRADAIEAFDRALALKLDYAEAYNNRGNIRLELNRSDLALADYDRALALKPQDAGTLVNRGSALRHLNRRDDALASLDAAIALNPELAEAYWNRALACLSFGDFEQGWRDYEWRWRRNVKEMSPRDFAQPQWRGEDLSGRTVLLHAEQGFGDSIQFVRYLPMVLAKGAKVVLEIPDDLKPLIAPAHGVVMASRGEKLPPFDLHCPLMSLPLAFATTLATVPATVPYLRVPADRIEKWRARLPRTGAPRIGLAWSGKPTHKNDHNRSIPLAQLAPLLTQSGFQFVSLQKEIRDADRKALQDVSSLLHLGGAFADFADTAATIACLDLVIAVDTAVAHLAGAMGKPVWILLPAIGDWRWMTEREDSPWYPTAWLLRQPPMGDWANVIACLVRELASFTPIGAATA
jgi:tetratricopeptide (TPR) repeat protein